MKEKRIEVCIIRLVPKCEELRKAGILLMRSFLLRFVPAFFILMLFLFPCAAKTKNCQAGASEAVYLEWENLLGGREADRCFDARMTGDGGFIAVGETASCYLHGNGGNDVLVIRLDPAGRLLWQKAIGGTGNDSGMSVRQTDDGGYIIAGATRSAGSSKDSEAYLLKIDASGQRQWEKRYGGPGEDCLCWVEQTSDGGFVAAGSTSSSGAGDFDIYLIRTDRSGRLLWEQTFGSPDTDQGACVVEAPGGGYVVAGRAFSPANGGYDVLLAKTDESGRKEWERTFGGKGWDIAEWLAPTEDGGYVLTGRTSSFNDGAFAVYLAKIGAGGTPEWERAFAGGWGAGKSVQQTGDGGYLVAGWTDSGSETQARIIKTDPDGNPTRDLKYGNSKFSREFSFYPAGNGEYIIAGWWAEPLRNNQYQSDGIQAYLARLKAF
ncbi:hypothetical membrane protein [Pelotomaculum thermopropionicum SI]|uniref:Hypothetical membrane protein n=1 Tax=Pelotomaculum thermopropionicum (strain DSM 13744 / JCM 10971 / SI) TaxID=370438 RepID=A5D362_PELTS|nr:hypothetical membrane protein [Pelotomaculum thermopropionicum SI]